MTGSGQEIKRLFGGRKGEGAAMGRNKLVEWSGVD
jgi:hypothetical protein